MGLIWELQDPGRVDGHCSVPWLERWVSSTVVSGLSRAEWTLSSSSLHLPRLPGTTHYVFVSPEVQRASASLYQFLLTPAPWPSGLLPMLVP